MLTCMARRGVSMVQLRKKRGTQADREACLHAREVLDVLVIFIDHICKLPALQCNNLALCYTAFSMP